LPSSCYGESGIVSGHNREIHLQSLTDDGPFFNACFHHIESKTQQLSGLDWIWHAHQIGFPRTKLRVRCLQRDSTATFTDVHYWGPRTRDLVRRSRRQQKQSCSYWPLVLVAPLGLSSTYSILFGCFPLAPFAPYQGNIYIINNVFFYFLFSFFCSLNLLYDGDGRWCRVVHLGKKKKEKGKLNWIGMTQQNWKQTSENCSKVDKGKHNVLIVICC